jgi:hypothetical protein
MQGALPGATVQGYERHIAQMTNDPKDRHVLATAVHIGAQIIVTHNYRHFPSHALLPHGIEAQSPDTFLGLLLDLAPDTMMRIIAEQAEDLKNPPQSVEQVLDNLALDAPAFADAVRERLRPR